MYNNLVDENRIKKEFLDLSRNPISSLGFSVGLETPNNYRKWKFILLGPSDTSYKKGLFNLSAYFPNGYPSVPPEICFITPIYHLNVNDKSPSFNGTSNLGAINLISLGFWKQGYTMRELICSIYSLFYYVDIAHPFDPLKVEEYKNDRPCYETKIVHFTRKYASVFSRENFLDNNNNWNFNI